MLLAESDRMHVDRAAMDFAHQHRDEGFGRTLRRSAIFAAAESASDALPAEGHSDERELAVIWRFSSQVFKLLGIDARIA